MAEQLIWVGFGLVLVIALGAAAASFVRHSRRAKARSRAALNTLLAEADAIAQATDRREDVNRSDD